MTLQSTFEAAATRLGYPLQLEPLSAVEERLQASRSQPDFSTRNAALIALLLDFPYEPSVLLAVLASELFLDRSLEQALMASDALRLIAFPHEREAERLALRGVARVAERLGPVTSDGLAALNHDRTALHARAFSDLQTRFAADPARSAGGAMKARLLERDHLENGEAEALLQLAEREADVEALLLLDAFDAAPPHSGEDPRTLRYASACAAVLARADAWLTAGLPSAAHYLLLLLADLESDDWAEAMIAESLLDVGDVAQAEAVLRETIERRPTGANETLIGLRARTLLASGELASAGLELAPYLDKRGAEADALARQHPQLVNAAVEYCLRAEIVHPLCEALPELLRKHPSDRRANLLRTQIEFGLLRSHGLDDAAFLLFRQLLIDFPGYRPAWEYFGEQLEAADPALSVVEPVLEAILTQHVFALPVWRGIAELPVLPQSWRVSLAAAIEACARNQL